MFTSRRRAPARVALVCLAVRLQGLLHWRSRRRAGRDLTQTLDQIKMHNTRLFTMQLCLFGAGVHEAQRQVKQHEVGAEHLKQLSEISLKGGSPARGRGLFSAPFLKLGARSSLL